MEFLLTSHTELLLNCEKTQLCMGHIVIPSFLLFSWSVSKYKTCNWHELSYIYFLTWAEYFFFFFSFQIFLLFSGLRIMCCKDLTKLTWPYRLFKIILAQITLLRFPLNDWIWIGLIQKMNTCVLNWAITPSIQPSLTLATHPHANEN